MSGSAIGSEGSTTCSDKAPVSLYRPSCGTEGAEFIDHWCGRCKRDEDFRNNDGESCPIVAATCVFDIDSPGYPTEWRYENSRPVCTAFDDEDETPRRDDSAAVGDLFAERPSA